MTGKVQERWFNHVVLAGSAYEVGRRQGEFLRERYPDYAAFLTSPRLHGQTPALADEARRLFAEHCPEINEEIRGFADSLAVPADHVTFYKMTLTSQFPGSCSHFSVLPAITRDRHVYLGRNYDWNLEDEMRLCTTRIEGLAAHIGFSLLLFGRFDGMNEHGLGIAMSAGSPGSQPQGKGLQFWAVIRTLLGRCRTVDEALARLNEMPLNSRSVISIADRGGKAALVEIFDAGHAVRVISADSPEQYLCATNHYNLPAMAKYNSNRMRQSLQRFDAIDRRLRAASPRADAAAMKAILTGHTPEGACCHYYSAGLGTLWSMLFDLTAGRVEVCFGSPQANPWHSFGLDTGEDRVYPARFPEAEAGKELWERL